MQGSSIHTHGQCARGLYAYKNATHSQHSHEFFDPLLPSPRAGLVFDISFLRAAPTFSFSSNPFQFYFFNHNVLECSCSHHLPIGHHGSTPCEARSRRYWNSPLVRRYRRGLDYLLVDIVGFLHVMEQFDQALYTQMLAKFTEHDFTEAGYSSMQVPKSIIQCVDCHYCKVAKLILLPGK